MISFMKFVINFFVFSIDNIKNKNLKSTIRKLDAWLLIYSRKDTKNLIIYINEKVFTILSTLFVLTLIIVGIFKASIHSNNVLSIYFNLLGALMLISGFLKLAYDKTNMMFSSRIMTEILFFSMIAIPVIFSILYLRDQKLIMFLVIFATLICFGIICFLYKYLPMGFLGIFHLFLSSIKQLLLLIHRKFEKGITITLLKLVSLFFSVLK
ncbi:MAG: hypothetical protein ACK567_05200 [Chitinophagales bacterium]|jgi:hypothetical protein